MKTENREKERNAGLMEAWSNAQYAGETEREKHTENSISKMHSLNVLQMCVFNAHVIYKSF